MKKIEAMCLRSIALTQNMKEKTTLKDVHKRLCTDMQAAIGEPMFYVALRGLIRQKFVKLEDRKGEDAGKDPNSFLPKDKFGILPRGMVHLRRWGLTL